ncbi:MAG: tRNA pseudouridine synthase, partial [Gammaproteobacteria bacterium]|nr:tRNA pseudouridine synthase [Gammaproteobacteria bacterium]
IICAGRTDAGVHAAGQVVHFKSLIERSDRAWVLGVNTHLPADISLRWVRHCSDDFHARYSALARCYRYIIDNQPIPSALWHSQATWCYKPLDIAAMQEASQHLIGEHDFSSFRGAHCQSKSPTRHVHFVTIAQQASFIIIDIQANAFLHHMVRNIMGVLMDIGTGKLKPEDMKTILMACDRKVASITAPAQGLCLMKVIYPEIFNLPVADDFSFMNLC